MLEWDKYFIALARIAASRSKCLKRKVGAVIVRDKCVLSTGYVGALRGMVDCRAVGFCNRDRMKHPQLCVSVHAELNAILQAARAGINIKGATLYSTLEPCPECLKAAYQAGIVRVVYETPYINSKRTPDEVQDYWRFHFNHSNDPKSRLCPDADNQPALQIEQIRLSDDERKELAKIFEKEDLSAKEENYA